MRDNARVVDSVQRYLMDEPDAIGVAEAYFRWLDGAWGPLVRVRGEVDAGIEIRLVGVVVLRLERRAGPGVVFEVAGGALARAGGTFSFSEAPGAVEVALAGFRPRLPMWVYRVSHGPVHAVTMGRFGGWLSRRG